MTTMKKFTEAKSDQLNADDLIGSNIIVKITKVRVTDEAQQACTVWYEGGEKKPWKPCKTMGRVLVAAWGENPQNYVGKSIELGRDPEVIFGGQKVGGIRIMGMSDIEADFDIALTISRGFKKPVRIKKLKVAAPPAPLAPELQKAGDDAAAQGQAIYVRWRDSLQADVKELIRPYNGAWSKVAKEVDAAKQPESGVE